MKLLTTLPVFARLFERGAMAAAIMSACVAAAQNSQTTTPDANSQGAGAANLQNNNSDTSDTTGRANATGKTARETTGSSALTAESFIKDAVRGNNSEIAMAEIAERKAQNAQVKQYAEMLRRDHKKANDELEPIAQAHGVAVTSTEASMHEEKTHDLNQVSGSEFDKAYIKDMLRDHQKDIGKFEKASQNLREPDVKRYAEKTLTTLRQHLQRAKQAAQAIGISESEVSSILNESPEAVGGVGEKQESESGSSTNRINNNMDLNP